MINIAFLLCWCHYHYDSSALILLLSLSNNAVLIFSSITSSFRIHIISSIIVTMYFLMSLSLRYCSFYANTRITMVIVLLSCWCRYHDKSALVMLIIFSLYLIALMPISPYGNSALSCWSHFIFMIILGYVPVILISLW